jgi:hypothetical protein
MVKELPCHLFLLLKVKEFRKKWFLLKYIYIIIKQKRIAKNKFHDSLFLPNEYLYHLSDVYLT